MVYYGGMADIDRSEINRALAKAIAYKQAGKPLEANQWAYRLVELLDCYEILAPAPRSFQFRMDGGRDD